jgi:hypothetical protein
MEKVSSDDIEKLHAEGMNDIQIAYHLGKKRAYITKTRKQLGLAAHQNSRIYYRDIEPFLNEKQISLFHIAGVLGTTRQIVDKLLRKHRVIHWNPEGIFAEITSEKIDWLRSKGFSDAFIAVELNILNALERSKRTKISIETYEKLKSVEKALTTTGKKTLQKKKSRKKAKTTKEKYQQIEQLCRARRQQEQATRAKHRQEASEQYHRDLLNKMVARALKNLKGKKLSEEAPSIHRKKAFLSGESLINKQEKEWGVEALTSPLFSDLGDEFHKDSHREPGWEIGWLDTERRENYSVSS